MCGSSECGTCIIDDIILNRKCASFDGSGLNKIKYKQNENITVTSGNKQIKTRQTVEYDKSLFEFRNIFKNELKGFIKHHVTKAIQRDAKKNLLSEENIILPEDSVAILCDFIKNISILEPHMTSSMFRNRPQVGYFTVVEYFVQKDPDVTKECYIFTYLRLLVS